jgi:hypothetical protein
MTSIENAISVLLVWVQADHVPPIAQSITQPPPPLPSCFAAFSMAGKHAQALWDAELAVQEGGQTPPAGALLVRATSLIQRGDSQGASRDLVGCPPAQAQPLLGAPFRGPVFGPP